MNYCYFPCIVISAKCSVLPQRSCYLLMMKSGHSCSPGILAPGSRQPSFRVERKQYLWSTFLKEAGKSYLLTGRNHQMSWEHLSGAWTAGDASWKVFTIWNLFWQIYLLLCTISCYRKREVRLINNFAFSCITFNS